VRFKEGETNQTRKIWTIENFIGRPRNKKKIMENTKRTTEVKG